MKKIIFWIILLSIIIFHHCFSDDSYKSLFPKWSDAILDCFNKIQNKESWAGSIQNPINPKKYLICEWNDNINILYQSILDILFTDIDNKVENYLESLPKEKINLNICEKVSDDFSYTWDFYKQYKDVCEKWVKDYMSKFIENNKNLNISIKTHGGIHNFVINESSKCIVLMNIKLKSYQDTAWLILNRNLVDSYKKDKQKFMTDLKDKYRKLLLSLTEYMAQVLKINNQWNKATKKAQK